MRRVFPAVPEVLGRLGVRSRILAAGEGSRRRSIASLHVVMLYDFYYLEQQSSLLALGQ